MTHSTKFWIIILSILILPVVLIVLFRTNNKSKFNRRVEQIEADGLPTSLDDMEKQYTLPAGVNNAADIYTEAFLSLQIPFEDIEPLLPASGSYKPKNENESYPSEVIEAIEKFIVQNDNTIKLLNKAAEIENCLWPRTRDDYMMANNHYADIFNSVKLLRDRNIFLVEKNQTDKLVRSFRVMTKLAKSFEKQPFLLDHLMSMNIKTLSISNLQTALSQANFNDDELIELHKMFSQLHDKNALHKTLIYERCCTIQFWKLPAEKQTIASFSGPQSAFSSILYDSSGIKSKDALITLDHITKNIEAAKLPTNLRDKAFTANEEILDQGLLSFLHFYLDESFVSMTDINIRDMSLIATSRCAATAIAIERFRNNHNSLPESLNELAKDYISELPRDPFDDNILRYKKHDTGYTIYSVGQDCTDNGGNSKEMIDENPSMLNIPPKQHDYTFTVKR